MIDVKNQWWPKTSCHSSHLIYKLYYKIGNYTIVRPSHLITIHTAIWNLLLQLLRQIGFNLKVLEKLKRSIRADIIPMAHRTNSLPLRISLTWNQIQLCVLIHHNKSNSKIIIWKDLINRSRRRRNPGKIGLIVCMLIMVSLLVRYQVWENRSGKLQNWAKRNWWSSLSRRFRTGRSWKKLSFKNYQVDVPIPNPNRKRYLVKLLCLQETLKNRFGNLKVSTVGGSTRVKCRPSEILNKEWVAKWNLLQKRRRKWRRAKQWPYRRIYFRKWRTREKKGCLKNLS